MKKDFHEIALESSLFKGRSDWYFCYLKSEKIAHVLLFLEQKIDARHILEFKEVARAAENLSSSLLHFAAGEINEAEILADIFSLLSFLRFIGTKGYIHKDNVVLLIQEYEQIVAKITIHGEPSPFISSGDFAIPEALYVNKERRDSFSLQFSNTVPAAALAVKDTNKRQIQLKDKTFEAHSRNATNTERLSLILDVVNKNKGVSIKDISAIVRGCSEKTIQRELLTLIEKGLVRREGERRWSVYLSTQSV